MTKKAIAQILGYNWERKFTLGGVDQNGDFFDLIAERHNIKDDHDMMLFIEEYKPSR